MDLRVQKKIDEFIIDYNDNLRRFVTRHYTIAQTGFSSVLAKAVKGLSDTLNIPFILNMDKLSSWDVGVYEAVFPNEFDEEFLDRIALSFKAKKWKVYKPKGVLKPTKDTSSLFLYLKGDFPSTPGFFGPPVICALWRWSWSFSRQDLSQPPITVGYRINFNPLVSSFGYRIDPRDFIDMFSPKYPSLNKEIELLDITDETLISDLSSYQLRTSSILKWPKVVINSLQLPDEIADERMRAELLNQLHSNDYWMKLTSEMKSLEDKIKERNGRIR